MFGTTTYPGVMSPTNIKESDHGSHQFNSPIWAVLIFLVFIFVIFFGFALMFNRRREGGEGLEGVAGAAAIPMIAAAASRGGENHGGYRWNHEWEIEHDIMENRYISAKEHGETQKLIVVQGKDGEIQGLKNTQAVLDKIAEADRRREEDARRREEDARKKAEAEAIAAKSQIQMMMWFGAKPSTIPARCGEHGGYGYADGYGYPAYA